MTFYKKKKTDKSLSGDKRTKRNETKAEKKGLSKAGMSLRSSDGPSRGAKKKNSNPREYGVTKDTPV